ncbi:MAG: pyrimidine-nucleoside phosphorylase [Thermoanaerobacteraceae bacterium]|nr:pyrimidine-nucleoside phosphorylase [Thermoanaerobacteraceae bacterium]
MRAYDIIAKKRDGGTLTREELEFLFNGYVDGSIPDYQMSAFTMAVFFQGMNHEETAMLTKIMLDSGDKIDLSSIPGTKVDKHSTGGVGDKTTLVVAPLVAAAGVPVAKMSGRGLGHTGGTIDKLSAIPGLRVELEIDEFLQQVREVGLAVVGQTGNLVPADKKLYALRDVTATVNSLPLIASSIMSKKLASGADKIVLDVKVGSGAFMKNVDQAFELARAMVAIGSDMGRETVAVITNMDQPLGNAVGNALEVREAIEVLKGRGPADLRAVCLELGAWMLRLGGKVEDAARGKEMLTELIETGKGLAKLGEMIAAQGGDTKVLENPDLLPQAERVLTLLADQAGTISRLHAEKVGLAAMVAGAGRSRKEDDIDLAAGVILKAKPGQAVDRGQVLAEVYTGHEQKGKAALEILKEAYSFGDYREQPLIYGTVTKNGDNRYR